MEEYLKNRLQNSLVKQALSEELLGALLGASGGAALPYLVGAQPSQNWTRLLPIALLATYGGLTGHMLRKYKKQQRILKQLTQERI